MDRPLRWGILGTGNIARQFAEGMATARHGIVTAVGSRNAATAQAFASAYKIPGALGSYEELIRSPQVDAIYLSLPNSMHAQWTIAALRAGKHMLCEKPIARDAAEAKTMFDEARRAGRLLMEAFMYRCHPQTRAVVDAVRNGAIGQVRLVRTSFCYRTRVIDGNIRFSRELAGGAVMDVGCYCVNFSRLIAGAEPTRIRAVGQLHNTKVDVSAAGVMDFPGGIQATFVCGMDIQANNAASICGTEGYIEIPVPWKPPVRDAIWILGRSTPPRQDVGNPKSAPPIETFKTTADVALYALEADEFAQAISNGTPAPVSEADTLGNMRVLDEIRAQIGVKF